MIEYVLFCAIKNKTFTLQVVCVKIPGKLTFRQG